MTQAELLATQARTSARIRIQAEATDPLVVRLVAQMQTIADVHDNFSVRWTGAMVDHLTWPALAADLTALVANWAALITVVMPDPDMIIAAQQDNGPDTAFVVLDITRTAWHWDTVTDPWSTSDTASQTVSFNKLVTEFGPLIMPTDDNDDR